MQRREVKQNIERKASLEGIKARNDQKPTRDDFNKIEDEYIKDKSFGERTTRVLGDKLEDVDARLRTGYAKDGKTQLTQDDIRAYEQLKSQYHDAIEWMKDSLNKITSDDRRKKLWDTQKSKTDEKFTRIINAMEEVKVEMQATDTPGASGNIDVTSQTPLMKGKGKAGFGSDSSNLLLSSGWAGESSGTNRDMGETYGLDRINDGVDNAGDIDPRIQAIVDDPSRIIDEFDKRYRQRVDERRENQPDEDLKEIGRLAASDANKEMIRLTHEMRKNEDTKLAGEIAFESLNTHIRCELYKQVRPEHRTRLQTFLGKWGPAEWNAQNTAMVALLGSLVVVNYLNRGDPLNPSSPIPSRTGTPDILPRTVSDSRPTTPGLPNGRQNRGLFGRTVLSAPPEPNGELANTKKTSENLDEPN